MHNELKHRKMSILAAGQYLPQRLKSTLFEIFSSGGLPKGEEKFQRTLIFVFEVIMQPSKHAFEIVIFFVFDTSGPLSNFTYFIPFGNTSWIFFRSSRTKLLFFQILFLSHCHIGYHQQAHQR